MKKAAGRYFISAMLLSVPDFVLAAGVPSLPWQQPGVTTEQLITPYEQDAEKPPVETQTSGTLPLPLPASLAPHASLPAANLAAPETLEPAAGQHSFATGQLGASTSNDSQPAAEYPTMLTDMQPVAALPQQPAPSTETQNNNVTALAPVAATPPPAYFNTMQPASGGLHSATDLDAQEEQATLKIPGNIDGPQPAALPPPQVPIAASNDDPSPQQPTLPWQRVPVQPDATAYNAATATPETLEPAAGLPQPAPVVAVEQTMLPVPETVSPPRKKQPPPPPSLGDAIAQTGGTKGSAFHDMLVYVYQQSPRLKAARHSLKASDERVAEAVSGFRPTLSANGDLGRQREQTGSQGWVYGTARDESLVLNQPLFNGHGTFAQFHAARARVSAERAHLITVEEQVFLDAITSYLDAVAKQQILALTRENRSHLQGYVTATEKRLKAGDSTQTDLAQAQTRLAQADTAVATAEANWIAADASYERNTGLRMMSTDFPVLPEGLPDTADNAVTLAKKAPEFTESAEQERAASHDIDAAASSLWPTVSLRGSMSSDLTPSLGLQNLRNDSLTVNVSIPLYQGGAEHARVREARELREKAHEDMIDTSRFMSERAKQAWHNYYAAYLVVSASEKSAEAAERALHGVEIEHQQGLRTIERATAAGVSDYVIKPFNPERLANAVYKALGARAA